MTKVSKKKKEVEKKVVNNIEKKNILSGLIGVLILVVIVVSVFVSKTYLVKYKRTKAGLSDYQAVFLDNGQVYFGKSDGRYGQIIKLDDVYYLQVNKDLQAGTNKDGDQPELSLIELGNELHGPDSKMKINRDHVLFIEDLKVDSKVMNAINAKLDSTE